MLNLFKVRIKHFMQNNTKINTQIRPPFPRTLHPLQGDACFFPTHLNFRNQPIVNINTYFYCKVC